MLSYRPSPNSVGTDSFYFQVSDGTTRNGIDRKMTVEINQVTSVDQYRQTHYQPELFLKYRNLRLRHADRFARHPLEVRLFDLTGRKILRRDFQQAVSVDHLPAGTYLYQLSGSGQTVRGKVSLW